MIPLISLRDRHCLLVATSLSAGWFLVAVGGALAADCSISGDTCTFSTGSDGPLIHTDQGASGSDSTPGGDGQSLTYIVESDLELPLPDGSAYQGVYIKQVGGDGSYSGPSAGGYGGDIAFDGPDSITATITEDLSISDAAAGILLWTQGGPGTDNNKNQGSNGAPGGDGGSIVASGTASDVSLLGSFANVSNGSDLVGVELRSLGGNGGRLNEGAISGADDGGNGGDGGTIDWVSDDVTVGTDSAPLVADSVVGVRLQSFGGRGPNDYNSHEDETQGGGGYSIGGAGGYVTFENSGEIAVTGMTNASGATFGIYAFSRGGDGGWAYDAGVADYLTNGGPGGAGGSVDIQTGASVTVTDTGTSAAPYGSAAVFAFSRGGEGGVGQHDHSGGSGGYGGSVIVEADAEITATGTNVDAIVARSQGGQGGAGLEDANDSTGGKGGSGGPVTVIANLTDDQVISAVSSPAGHDSGRGIVAQSLSSLGGVGGDGNAAFGEPGGGGAGGNGGPVTVTIDGGTITTDGTDDLGSGLDYAAGVFAQSIGGGGGDGGDFTGFFGGEGGAGGVGGSGDSVTVENDGSLDTSGAQAYGVLAQSIGGGGGAGGLAAGVVVALGGSGGTGGESGTVAITNTGTIETSGYNATGVLAQSIVGGGGAAGFSSAALSIGGTGGDDSGTTAGTVTIANTGAISATGDAAAAVVAQSIAGGGGSAAGLGDADDSSVGVFAIGSDGGGGGAGGQVTVTDIGTLSTQGEFAPGLQAQSIGGGGGAGGNAFGIGVLTIPGGAVGGQSGSGGNGGTIAIDNAAPASVTTDGLSSAGLLLQSIGGGGGSGGNATTAGVLDLVQFGIGGSAEGAGTGGTASATLSDAMIETRQSQSAGIVAQSIGGGGGSGGSGMSKAAGFLNIGFSAGGFAGGGGDGGEASVTVTDGSAISTATGVDTAIANDAIGILVQSIGGGGGTGGTAASSAITTGVPVDPEDPDFTVTLNAQYAIGGRGGAGGAGDNASAELSDGSSVTTGGAGSHGILVQSIGGGGGSGGDASTATVVVPDSTETFGLAINAALGGAGGNGGGGGAAVATAGSATPSDTDLTVTTTGDYANGVVVQSIGGGGGNSGVPSSSMTSILGATTASLTLDVGAANLVESEAGADGGAATLNLYGDSSITTGGAGSRGAVVQSIGGGGGTVQGGELKLGVAIGKLSPESNIAFGGHLNVGLGATGGTGGASDLVTVEAAPGSVITTGGVDADGILAQSIGGGGGLAGTLGSDSGGGSSSWVDTNGVVHASVDANVSLGGEGGTGGDSGGINLVYGSRITTTGDRADGVVAQAIGGGGGTGGTAMSSGAGDIADLNIGIGGTGGAAGDGGAITADFNDDAPGNGIQTAGYMAHGVLLQSIGGGGGMGGDGSDVADGRITVGSGFGGAGGASGDGGTVTTRDSSWIGITTSGADAYGVVAQSIGGGGGIGGAGTAEAADQHIAGFGVDLTVGGQGGSSGDGGEVSSAFGGTVNTHGNRAFGVVAQSIGGGGGIAGVGSADNVASVSVGGFGGSGGNGGDVTVDFTGGTIQTRGGGAHAVIAQSIGGGGGIGGDLSVGPFDLTPSTVQGAGGTGGTVTVELDGGIITTGDMAYGVVAQSIGGGGGLGGGSGGTFAGSTSGDVGLSDFGSGDVSVTTHGSISATGADSVGILAQSMGSGNSADSGYLGTVSVTVSGDVAGGSGEGVGILMAQGHQNLVTINNGATVQAGSGTAIRYVGKGTTAGGAVTDVVVDEGTIIGDVIFENNDGNTAGTVTNNSNTLVGADLYAANIANNGRMVIGDDNAGHTTRITGDFAQSTAGTLAMDVDFVKDIGDMLLVEGDASLGGRLEPFAASALPGGALPLMRVAGAMSGDLMLADDALIDFDLAKAGGVVTLRIAGADFTPPELDLDANQTSAARHLEGIWDAGGGAYGELFAALDNLERAGAGGYGAALDQLRHGTMNAAAARAGSDLVSFNDKLLSCPRFDDGSARQSEVRCVWGSVTRGAYDQDGTASATGFSRTGTMMAMGAQLDLSDGWFLGGALAYGHTSFDDDVDVVSLKGDSAFAGIVLKYETGPWELAAALSGSYGWNESRRTVSIPGFESAAAGSPDVWTVGGRLHGAYTVAGEVAYAKPALDLDLVRISAPGYDESGAGLLNLSVDSETNLAFIASPSVEVGAKIVASDDLSLRTYANAGVSVSTLDSWDTDAGFVDAPAGTDNFPGTIPIDDVVARLGAGVQFTVQDHVDLRVQYAGELGDTSQAHVVSLRVNISF